MKAITVYQPYASLIAEGFKTFEIRPWHPGKHATLQRIAIHAAGRHVDLHDITEIIDRLEGKCPGYSVISPDAIPFLESCRDDPRRLPKSAVICTAFLGRPRRCGAMYEGSMKLDPHLWAWPITSREKLDPPSPAKGNQRFWQWEPSQEPERLL